MEAPSPGTRARTRRTSYRTARGAAAAAAAAAATAAPSAAETPLTADEEGEPENGDGLEATAADQADASLPGYDAPAWFDDAFSEAGRAPEEYKDEEQAVSRVPASEQIQFDVMGMMLCNYKDEAGAAGKSTIAQTSAEGPPGPPPLQQHF